MAKKTAAKKKRISKKGNVYLYVYVTQKQKTDFEKIAAKKGTTQSALMRNVLEDYLDKHVS